jgi:hypothetical protein
LISLDPRSSAVKKGFGSRLGRNLFPAKTAEIVDEDALCFGGRYSLIFSAIARSIRLISQTSAFGFVFLIYSLTTTALA